MNYVFAKLRSIRDHRSSIHWLFSDFLCLFYVRFGYKCIAGIEPCRNSDWPPPPLGLELNLKKDGVGLFPCCNK